MFLFKKLLNCKAMRNCCLGFASIVSIRFLKFKNFWYKTGLQYSQNFRETIKKIIAKLKYGTTVPKNGLNQIIIDNSKQLTERMALL